MAEEWTTAQVAYVLNEPLDSLKRELERGPVKSRVDHVGGLRVRKIGLHEIVFLHAQRELRNDLTPQGRARLYEAWRKVPTNSKRAFVTVGQWTCEFARNRKEVGSRLRELKKLASEIDTSSGEALIKGTAIEVHRIAALLDGGMTVDAVLRDYPSLNERQVVAAKAYAEINPKVGRPYPKITAKAAMRNSGLDALDEVD